GRDHARDAGGDDPADARSGASLMAARFERAVERRAAGAGAGFGERVDFGVRLAGPLMEPLPHDHAVGRDHDRADEWIGTGASGAARGVKQRALHVVALYHFSSNRPSTYSLAENGTRSSIPSPTPT